MTGHGGRRCWRAAPILHWTPNQSLVQYGQRNLSKPTADAVLVLNHKRAAEYLWANRELNIQNVCAMHALLTDDHALEEVLEYDHFLPEHRKRAANPR